MFREILRPHRHKLAILASVVLVLALTALGVVTQKVAERQTKVEHTVEIQHTQVVQALCNRPYTEACLRRAVNIVKTCLQSPSCSSLLGKPILAGSDISGSRDTEEESGRAEGEGPGKAPNSSSGNTGKGSHPHPHSHPHKTPKPKHHPNPFAPPTFPAPAPVPPPEEGPPGKGKGNGPPPQANNPNVAPGLVPQAVESIEGLLQCMPELNLGCAQKAILGTSDIRP